MATSVPDLIAAHQRISSDGKLLSSQAFKRVKDGQIANTTLSSLGSPIGIVESPKIVAAIRSLEEHGYALVDEEACRLEDVLRDQDVEVSVKLVLRVKPLDPQDAWSVNDRRFNPKDEQPAWDRIQVGRMVYTARVSNFMGQFALTVRARHGDALGERTLVEGAFHPSLADAWNWVDELVAGIRDMHARGETLPGASGDDPHAIVVEHLVEHGWEPAEAMEASIATLGEGDPRMRIEAALEWLSRRRPPLALPAPGETTEIDPDKTLYENAVRLALDEDGITVARVRQEFGVPASRAAAIVDRMEAAGVVGPREGALPRALLVTPEEAEAMLSGDAAAIEVLDEEEEEEDVFPDVARWASAREEISVDMVERVFSASRQQAIVILDRLQRAGVIDDMGNPRPKVLMRAEQVEAMLSGGRDE